MNTQTNTEGIDALLRSTDIEDVILGCRIAAEHLGQQWCRKHLQENVYNRGCRSFTDYHLLEFDRFYIWIGPQWIQYYSSYHAVIKDGNHAASRDSDHFKSFTTNT